MNCRQFLYCLVFRLIVVNPAIGRAALAANNETCSNELESACAGKCHVSDGELEMECSKVELRSLMQQLKSAKMAIRALAIHETEQLIQVPGKLFANLIVRQLDLSRNGIIDISSRAFWGLEESLISLNLASNKLKTLPDLSNLQLLQSIDLTGNVLSDLKTDFFAKNLKLKDIKMDPDKTLTTSPPATASQSPTDPSDLSAGSTSIRPMLPRMGGLAARAVLSVLTTQMPPNPAPAAPNPAPNFLAPDAAADSMNTLIGVTLLNELVRNLPALLTSFASVRIAQPPVPASVPLLLHSIPASDVSSTDRTAGDMMKLSPELIQQALAGSQVPGVPPEAMPQMIHLFSEYILKNSSMIAVAAAPSPSTQPLAPPLSSPSNSSIVATMKQATVATDDIAAQAAKLFAPGAPLPPFSSLPTDLVNKVIAGGTIPGLDASRTEEIKKRYMDMLFGGAMLGPMPAAVTLAAPTKVVSTSTQAAPSTTASSQTNNVTTAKTTLAPVSKDSNATSSVAPNFLQSVPPKFLPVINGTSNTSNEDRLTAESVADLAAGLLPNLSQVPPDLTGILMKTQPKFFDKVIDALKPGFEPFFNKVAGVPPAFLDKLPTPDVDLYRKRNGTAPETTYELDGIERKTSVSDADQAVADRNLALYTGLALAFIALLTAALVAFFCYRLRKKKRQAHETRPETNVGSTTVYLGNTPPALDAPKKSGAVETIGAQNKDSSTVFSFQDEDGTPPFVIKKEMINQHPKLSRQILPDMIGRGVPLPPLYHSSPKKLTTVEEEITSDMNVKNESKGKIWDQSQSSQTPRNKF